MRLDFGIHPGSIYDWNSKRYRHWSYYSFVRDPDHRSERLFVAGIDRVSSEGLFLDFGENSQSDLLVQLRGAHTWMDDLWLLLS